MKKNLTGKETLALTSMLFGMFFGAGNLIFPAAMGPAAGKEVWIAFLGMFLTAVGLPLLAIAALGISRCDGVVELSSKVSPGYGKFFSTLLYLTIGPLFAIPRCASTSFSVGAVNLLPDGVNEKVASAIFTFIFFAAVLLFSLKPSGIMTWIGKILNPIFLCFLGVLVIAALIRPIGSFADVLPAAGYETAGGAFFKGFLEGYGTLDALAGLAFGLIVIAVVRKQGVTEPTRVAANTAKAGIFSCLFMGLIYLCITLVAAQSSAICADCENGGEVLGLIAEYYFHGIGAVLMLAIVTLACLKTAIGLVTSCSEAFAGMYPKTSTYTGWAVLFCVVAFVIANFGLTTIVAYCVPVLMFLYPLAITLILLAMLGKWFDHSRAVYAWTTGFTLVAAFFDFLSALSDTLQGSGVTDTALPDAITRLAAKILPFFDFGLGWICLALVGFAVGLCVWACTRNQKSDPQGSHSKKTA